MQRIRQLDGVRAVAILAVFLHHSLHVRLLWMGVDLFFVLSGFLITGVLLDAKRYSLGAFFAHFYARRARRILPPYALMLVLASIVFGVAWMKHWYLYLLLTNLLLPLNIAHPKAFDPLWSLAVEEQFYLVWPFAVYFLDTRRLRQLCVVLIVLAPTLRAVFHFAEHWPIYTLTPFRMDLLAMGGLLCIEWKTRRASFEKWGTKIGIPLCLTGLAGLGLLMRFGYSTHANTRAGNVLIYESCLLISTGVMLFALGGKGIRWLQWGPLTYIGQVSYSMYLVHVGILTLLGNRFSSVETAVIGFALTLGYAAVSWSLMESRLLGRHRSQMRPQLVST